MRWEELTGDQFPKAVEAAQGVCLLPLSVIERHAHHLPLGTDMYIGRELCRRATELEPAVIFPWAFAFEIMNAATTASAPNMRTVFGVLFFMGGHQHIEPIIRKTRFLGGEEM